LSFEFWVRIKRRISSEHAKLKTQNSKPKLVPHQFPRRSSGELVRNEFALRHELHLNRELQE
jgi:hypothetical protein